MKKFWGLLLIFAFFFPQKSSATIYSVGLDKNLYTSDFMIGSVVVSVIFPESNGVLDPNIENWTDERKAQALSEIMTGLDWWSRQNTRSKLTFTYVTQTVPTKYEPITRPYYDESLWIPEIMSQLGYVGTRWTSTRSYVNALRTQHNADWGFVIFMVDSLKDNDGKFADGFFAYSYLGGPFSVMTYDNNGYGIANMDVVTAHETGHIFNALDQYAGASSPFAYTNGYFPTINGNHVYAATGNDPDSIMRGGIRWGLDQWTKLAIGWRDNDNNGRDDIVDQTPHLTFTQQAQSSVDDSTGFTGTAKIKVLARQGNGNGYGFTVDSINKVEYRLKNHNWIMADPTDGAYDAAEENFAITISASQATLGAQAVISSNDLDVRVVTSFSIYMGSSGTDPSPSGTLNDAHPYPNPYKPSSDPNHSFGVNFTSLTPSAKVQVFTPSGETIFEETSDSTGNAVRWTSISTVNSGIYFFLITDENGQKKKGKLAIIK